MTEIPKYDPEHLEVVMNRRLRKWRASNPGVRLNLEGADLRLANLHRVDLQRAELLMANLQGADLREANLRGARLHRANLQDADLREAELREAKLREANLMRADLRGAHLWYATMLGVDLRGADLRDADVLGINLTGAKLTKSQLELLRGVKDINLADIKVYDDEFESPGSGRAQCFIHIDRGSAPPELIREILGLMSDVHRGVGGSGLKFSDLETRVLDGEVCHD